MKPPSYRERRWRPIRWWEIAQSKDPSQMPFLRYYPEPPALLVAQILTQAKRLAVPEPPAAAPERAEDPWGPDGRLVSAWFALGDRIAFQPPARVAEQGGTHA